MYTYYRDTLTTVNECHVHLVGKHQDEQNQQVSDLTDSVGIVSTVSTVGLVDAVNADKLGVDGELLSA